MGVLLLVPGQDVNTSPSKAPAGVNRRNAVLFTRKKQAQATTTAPSNDKEDDETKSKPSTPSRAASKKVLSSTDQNLELIETEVRSPQPPPPPDSADELGTPSKGSRKKAAPKSPPKSPAKGNKKSVGSFQSYRRGGDMPTETDDDTVTDSATDAIGATSEDGDETDTDSDSDAEGGGRNALTANMTLEPLDRLAA